MSTRYVWGKYNKDRVFEEGVYYDDDAVAVWGYNESTILDNPVIYWAQYSNYDISGNGKMSVSGLISNGTITSDNDAVDPYELEIGDNFATIFSSSPLNSDSVSGIKTLYMNKSGNRTVRIHYSSVGDYRFSHYNYPGPGEYNYWSGYNDTKGSYISDVSGASQSTYPDDGIQGSYWYEYQGSDNIDPASVSIPSSILGGQQIQITVTPGSGKVYGGTVSYQYQVNIGSGWTTIATTSATSRSYTVPSGTASIQVRVRAQDNIGFTSSTYVTSSSVNVINNQPPTAPGSITVTNVIAGQNCTITLTAATDPDGTIASYIYERSVDGSAWAQVANVNSLTQTDLVSGDWGTIAYRACAVDDDGASGPYVTSSTTVVNSGWVIISGPASDMGAQPKPFTFTITPSISGTTTSDQIAVDVTLDGSSIYNESMNPDTEIELEVDTRLMRTGSHSIAVSATCASFVPAADEYTFTVPAVTIPDGGRMEQLEAQDGEVIFPLTIARAVAGLENIGVESKVHPGAYTGSGTYGSGNPNSLALEFEPKLVIIQGTSGRMAVMIKPSGVGISIGASDSTTLNVTWDGDSVSWYNGVNAANQMNTASETYSYTAFG